MEPAAAAAAAGVRKLSKLRARHSQDETIAWIEMHFPGIFKDIHFGNHWAKEGKSLSKSEICRNIGAHCLIDDNPGYAIECAEAGINVLLYDWKMEYPWSKTPCG